MVRIIKFNYNKEIDSIFFVEKELFFLGTGYIVDNLPNGIYYGLLNGSPATGLTTNFSILNKSAAFIGIGQPMFFYNVHQASQTSRWGALKYYIINFKN